jgi:hypothetical protein
VKTIDGDELFYYAKEGDSGGLLSKILNKKSQRQIAQEILVGSTDVVERLFFLAMDGMTSTIRNNAARRLFIRKDKTIEKLYEIARSTSDQEIRDLAVKAIATLDENTKFRKIADCICELCWGDRSIKSEIPMQLINEYISKSGIKKDSTYTEESMSNGFDMFLALQYGCLRYGEKTGLEYWNYLVNNNLVTLEFADNMKTNANSLRVRAAAASLLKKGFSSTLLM